MGQTLGVGIAGEYHAVGLQRSSEFNGVLDNPVVHQSDIAGGVEVRVSVHVVRLTVGGPSGMSDA